MYEFKAVIAQPQTPKVRQIPSVVPSTPPPGPATVLRHCRCLDCGRWSTRTGTCHEFGFITYIPREQYPKPMQRFWNDLNMIRPDEWHWCASYDGPSISKDVQVWPQTAGGGT